VLHGGGRGKRGPSPCGWSGAADGVRASEIEHAVEHFGGDGDLGGLGLVAMEAQPITDDPLPAPDIIQKVSLACRRAIHVQRVAALRDLISAA
jgi:hypothetical protein